MSVKNGREIERMRAAGRVVSLIHRRIEAALGPGVTTADLDEIARVTLAEAGARSSFLHYGGGPGRRPFPGNICASVNDVIVHGIPGPLELEEGDIISLDVGVFYEGLHVDSAWTFPIGEVETQARELLEATEGSLEAAIGQCEPGKRLGDLGGAVQHVAEAAGFSVVREYVGHGIGRSLHEDPQIPNYGPPGRRELLAPGMTLAIEPMVNAKGAATEALDDGWTVVTADGGLSAHFEHTVAITPEGREVLTRRR